MILAQDTSIIAVLLKHYPVLFALRIVEIAAVVFLGAASLFIPRRPDVFDEEGRLVDRMYTVYAFSRFTFAWPYNVLSLAGKKKNLDMADLPRPDHFTRAKEVSADWKAKNFKQRLWLSVILAHGGAFALQWVLTLGTAVLNFAPQWVILQLLRILETKKRSDSYGVETWMWVVWLGAVIVAQAVRIHRY